MLIFKKKLPEVEHRRILLLPVMRYLMQDYTLSRDDAYIFGLAYQRFLAANVIWVVGVLLGAAFRRLNFFSNEGFLEFMAFAAEWQPYVALSLIGLLAYHFFLMLRFHNPREHDLRWFIRSVWPDSGLGIRLKIISAGSIMTVAALFSFFGPWPDFLAYKAKEVPSVSYVWLGFFACYLFVLPFMAHMFLISLSLVYRYSAGDDVLKSTSRKI